MWFFGIGILIFIVGAFLSLAAGKFPKMIAPLAASSVVGGSVFCAIDAIRAISNGQSVEAIIPWRLPFGNAVFGLDPLSAFFVLPIAVVVALAAVYGTEYLKPPRGGMSVGVHWFFFNFLAAAMLLVVSARNGFVFLICWEAMSLASFFLVIGDYQSDSARRAGWIYLIATHLGTACLLALFLLLGRESGSLDFAGFSAGSSAGALFLLAVVGFGTKAGFMPLHVWLPEAHPAAPSHVSAVMSGVMIKTGIYGLLRTLTFLGDMPAWWGWTVLGIGAASGVLGVLFALAQHDLKRLLAYSSVENIGIIALGIGMGMLGISYGIPAMAALGFLGALLHVLNHSLFKSLLFLGAGAVQHGAGTRDMNRLGGLLKRMPIVGAAFLVGACAISGLPPLNGFVGELMIYLGAIGSVADANRNDGASWVVLGVLVVGGLALIGGLAAACFAKAFGGVFLGEPRTEEAKHAHEAGRRMRFSMLALAAACIIIALSAPIWPKILQPCVAAIAPKVFEDLPGIIAEKAVFPLSALCGATWIFIALAVGLAVVRKKMLSGRDVSKSTTWDCGYIGSSPRIQYTASSFAQPIVLLFRMFLRSKYRLDEPQGFFPERASFRSETPDVLGDYFYRPAMAGVAWAASKLRWLQHGRIQLYVLYIALTIFVLLIWKLG
jgi:formate hydrogenlyase subunit 3/multisubunit Na+/H+ antiporter MnhD subunit